MALMLGSLYDALKAAGVDDTKAREAAEEVAILKKGHARADVNLIVLRWMVVANIALNLTILWGVLG